MDTLSYYLLYIPRELAWWSERCLRLAICVVRGHRWTTPARVGCMPFVNGSELLTSGLTGDYGPDERWLCGRCGKQGGLLREVTFSAKTYNPYRIW